MELVKRGERVYEANREKWERLYPGKIIAIEIEGKILAGVGETLDEACEKALEEYPDKRFYFRKVGPCPATSHLYLLLWG